jgi:hypothetical protein
MIPVEMKLDDRGLPFEAPGTYSRGALADTRLVDEDDQAPFSLGFFFKRRPGAPLSGTHGIFIPFDSAFVGLLGAETQAAQDSPNLRLPEAHPMHAFDDGGHALECPQFSAKSIFSWASQDGCTHSSQLLLVQLGRAPTLWYGSQCINTAFIE